MKILQLIDSLNVGGAERMAVNISNALFDNKIENIVVCTRRKGPLLEFLPKSIKCISLNKRSSIDIFALILLVRIVKREKPQFLHAHSTSIFWGVFVKLLFPKIKLLWHDHNGNRKFEKNFWLKLMLNFSNGLVVVNQDLLDWATNEIPNKKAVLIVNFPFMKLKMDVVKNKDLILHLANLRHPKDHMLLIEAARILKKRNKTWFKICFAGNDYNDLYSANLKNKILEYGLENEIVILGAVNDTAGLLSISTIGVLCSSSEGLPVSLLEYGLAALPVVVTNVGQCAEVVGHGKFGTVISPSDPMKLADAIEWHLLNREVSIEIGKCFKRHVEESYGSEKFIQEYLKILGTI